MPRAAPAGRPPSTTAAELERVAFALFAEKGFEATTVEDIARAAGIGRRTFFRYFASKNDIVWGDWDASLEGLHDALNAAPHSLPVTEVLCRAVVNYNRFDPVGEERHRRRMELILHVPALQAHSTLRYAQWRRVIAQFVAGRRQVPIDTLEPQLLAYAALGAALAAYEQWLACAGDNLSALLTEALTLLFGWGQD